MRLRAPLIAACSIPLLALALPHASAAQGSFALRSPAVQGFGELGGNSVNPSIGYTPPCSKGPGDKTYTYTLYSLSKSANLGAASSASVTRDALLSAIKPITLGKAVLNVTYAGPASAGTDAEPSSPPAPRS